MTTHNQFDGIKYFNERENWGDVSRFSVEFFRRLDAFRGYVGSPFKIHCGYSRSGHSENSQHYIGNCIDGHFSYGKVSLFEEFLTAERFGFHGIGLYPNKGRPFIHLDMRELPDFKRARWIRTNTGVYYPVNAETIKKYVI